MGTLSKRMVNVRTFLASCVLSVLCQVFSVLVEGSYCKVISHAGKLDNIMVLGKGC